MAYAPSVGWVCFHPTWNLDRFLTDNKPSTITHPSKFWVHVPGPKSLSLVGQGHGQGQAQQYAQRLWLQLLARRNDITVDDVIAIGQTTGYTSGKWLVYRRSKDVDVVWDAVARATVGGTLGSDAKVSTRSSAQSSARAEHVICVYTTDFTDEGDVWRVEQRLRDVGIFGPLSYKPDVFTTCGIYFNNDWDIKPTLYSSQKP